MVSQESSSPWHRDQSFFLGILFKRLQIGNTWTMALCCISLSWIAWGRIQCTCLGSQHIVGALSEVLYIVFWEIVSLQKDWWSSDTFTPLPVTCGLISAPANSTYPSLPASLKSLWGHLVVPLRCGMIPTHWAALRKPEPCFWNSACLAWWHSISLGCVPGEETCGHSLITWA